MAIAVEHHEVDAGPVRLHVTAAGRGPPVLLLHGFPELAWTWRHAIDALAAAGFRAIAPDGRGYGRSSRPRDVRSYAMASLLADVDALLRWTGAARASLVGHDWGGVLAWRYAERHPDRVERLAVLDAPHPARLAEGIARRPSQALRSSYMLALQVPWLPERLLAAREGALLRRVLRSFRAAPVDAELEPFVAAAREPGGLTGPVHYYRAMMRGLARRAARGGMAAAGAALRGLGRERRPSSTGGGAAPVPSASSGTAPARGPASGAPAGGPARRARARVDVPTLVIWGEDDPVLLPALARPPPWFTRARVEVVAGASHDVHLDAPERVHALLVEHLRGG